MKENKIKIIVTSILTILPMAAGLFLWDKLPETMATHFGASGEANGWSSKAFTVFGLPGLLLLVHLLVVFVTLNDPKRRNIGRSMLNLVFWLVPVVSWICAAGIYSYSLGMEMDQNVWGNILTGLLFLVLGNYMSKNKQNYTVGIRLPWTLHSTENWNRTHRLAGKLWIGTGFVFLLNIFLRISQLLPILLIPMILIPCGYSFFLYKNSIDFSVSFYNYHEPSIYPCLSGFDVFFLLAGLPWNWS